MQRTESLGKNLMVGKIEGRRRRGRQRMRWLDGITDSMDKSLISVQLLPGTWGWTGKPGMMQSIGSQRVRHDWANELNWTELNWLAICISSFEKYLFRFFAYFPIGLEFPRWNSDKESTCQCKRCERYGFDALCFRVKLIPGSLLSPDGKQNISLLDTLDIPIPRSPQCRGVLPMAGIKL